MTTIVEAIKKSDRKSQSNGSAVAPAAGLWVFGREVLARQVVCL